MTIKYRFRKTFILESNIGKQGFTAAHIKTDSYEEIDLNVLYESLPQFVKNYSFAVFIFKYYKNFAITNCI